MADKNNWYIAGLNFECQGCGICCSGPEQGYIWLTKPEIEFIAEFLYISIGRLRKNYLKRYGFRLSIIENEATRDCIFLKKENGRKVCTIYPVRPNQCRTWPFWPTNLRKSDNWNEAGEKCPGINKGKHYSFEEIESLKNQKKWWSEDE